MQGYSALATLMTLGFFQPINGARKPVGSTRPAPRLQMLKPNHRGMSWTNETFPSPLGSNAGRCGTSTKPHICDPDGLLSKLVAQSQDLRLAELAQGAGPPACPINGYHVYVAVLGNLDESFTGRFESNGDALTSFARDFGRKVGVLGRPCHNGAAIVYSGYDRALVAVTDEGSLIPVHYVGQDLADAVISNAIAEVEMDLQSPPSNPSFGLNDFKVQPTRIFLTTFGAILGLAWVFLSMCCVYDTFMHWRHRHHWAMCNQKIRRVHNVFQDAGGGDLRLCPFCVEWVPEREDNQVKKAMVCQFLCGHKFHTECLQKWFKGHPQKQGRCPVCELPHSYSSKDEYLSDISDKEACRAVNAIDEIKAFFLRSLNRQYPDIITEPDCSRWKSSHTEIWLSELECPRYMSIFQQMRHMKSRH